jgi:hypothetical protein
VLYDLPGVVSIQAMKINKAKPVPLRDGRQL